MADLEFNIAPRRVTPLTFTLGDGHEYVFTPPKSAVMMMPVIDANAASDNAGIDITKATFNWLGEGLSDEDHDRILTRLRDPEDGLDVDTLADVVKALTEKVASRPST